MFQFLQNQAQKKTNKCFNLLIIFGEKILSLIAYGSQISQISELKKIFAHKTFIETIFSLTK